MCNSGPLFEKASITHTTSDMANVICKWVIVNLYLKAMHAVLADSCPPYLRRTTLSLRTECLSTSSYRICHREGRWWRNCKPSGCGTGHPDRGPWCPNLPCTPDKVSWPSFPNCRTSLAADEVQVEFASQIRRPRSRDALSQWLASLETRRQRHRTSNTCTMAVDGSVTKEISGIETSYAPRWSGQEKHVRNPGMGWI